MSFLTKALAALLATAVLCGAGLWWRLDTVAAQLKAAGIEVTRLEGEVKVQSSLVKAGNKAASRHRREKLLSDEQHKKELNALTAALVRNPGWAGDYVPADVSAALGVQPLTQTK
jgi:hypothetical protein